MPIFERCAAPSEYAEMLLLMAEAELVYRVEASAPMVSRRDVPVRLRLEWLLFMFTSGWYAEAWRIEEATPPATCWFQRAPHCAYAYDMCRCLPAGARCMKYERTA